MSIMGIHAYYSLCTISKGIIVQYKIIIKCCGGEKE